MAYGPRHCACCGDILGVEEHHLYLRADGCPDDLTVWLCHHCHGRAHGMRRRINIRERTIAGLKAAKARGVKLGTPYPEKSSFHDRAAASTAGTRSGATRAALADEFARLIRPLLDGELAGLSANAAAVELNRRGVQTARGNGRWSAQAVLNLKARKV